MRKNGALTWLVVTVWWLLTALVWLGQVMTIYAADGHPPPLQHTLQTQLATALLWVPITMALLWCVRRSPIERTRVWGAIGTLSLAVIGVILLRAVLVAAFNFWVGWYPQLP